MPKQSILHIRESELPLASEIKLGREVRFTPACFFNAQTCVHSPVPGKHAHPTVEGTVCYIHRAHRYFLAAYQVGDCRLLEGFKF